MLSGVAITDDIHGLDSDTTYYFRIRATGTGAYSESGWSSVEVSAKTDIDQHNTTELPEPMDVTATAGSATTITVTWEAVGNATGYIIEYSIDSGFAHGIVFEHEVDDGEITTADIHHGLEPSTTYYVRVMAIGDGVVYSDSDWSETESAKTKRAFIGEEVVWGLFYPNASLGMTNPHPDIPTGQELLDLNLEGFYEVSGSPMPSFTVSPIMSAADWASTGTTFPFVAASAKLYILIRQGEGTITDITNDLNGMSQFPAFEPYSVVIDGITYNGVVTKQDISIWDGNTPFRVFVSAAL